MKRQRGIALLIVLGLVALISAWAVNATYEDMVELRRIQNFQDLVRARQACVSGLNFAVQLLLEDSRKGPRDDLKERWAQPMPPFKIDDGQVQIRIVDAERFFDLNALLGAKGRAEPAVVRRVKQWFVAHERDPALVDALVDWMDADSSAYGPGGAEDPAYYDRPYHVPNRPFVRWHELAQVRGFHDRKLREQMAKAFVVLPLPAWGQLKLNLNTASEDALLLALPQLSRAEAAMLVEARPFDSVKQAIQGQPWAAKVNPARLSIASRFFIVTTDASFGRAHYIERFVLERKGKGIRLLMRERVIHE